jgi:hypothetical protein
MKMKLFFWGIMVLALCSIKAQNTYTIGTGTNLVTSGGINLVFESGNLTNNGTWIDDNATITFAGAITYAGTGTTTLNQLVINHTAATSLLNNLISISGTFTPTAGTLNANGNLRLLSSATATARIATGSSSGGYVTGNIIMQRYIQGSYRKFRFLAHPFSAAMNITELTDDIDITGTITGSNANAFTATTSNNPSAFTFTEANGNGALNDAGWLALTSGNSVSTLGVGQGIRVLVRGTKGQTNSLNGGTYTPNAVTLSITGNPRQGDFTQTLNYSGATKGWNLISNPYASNIDWTLVTRTNVDNAVYIYRPSTGNYASYINGSSTNGGSNIIETGNAFFVRANAASSSLGWQEADKTATSQPNTMFRTSNNINNRLLLSLTNDTTKTVDEAIIRFGDDPATDVFDASYDAKNLSVTNDLYVLDSVKEKYSIYHGSALKMQSNEKREVLLGMDNLIAGNYTLTAKTLNAFTLGNVAYLQDKQQNTLTEITDSIAYTFSVGNNQSTVQNRFAIVLNAKQLPAWSNNTFTVTTSPNPVKDVVTVAYTGLDEHENTNLVLVATDGRIVYSVNLGNVSAGKQIISLQSFARGSYTIKLLNGNHQQAVQIIKQ